MSGKRRGRGEGSVTRLGDGRWQARVDLGWQDGRRVRKAFYGRTRQEVLEKLRRALAERERGGGFSRERDTVEAFLRRWLETVRPAVRPATYRHYESICRVHLIPALGRLRLGRLSPAHVEAMLARKLEAGLSPRRVHHLRAVLRRALGQALRWGELTRNAAALAAPPRVAYQPPPAMDPATARRILEAVAGDRLGPLYTVALATGLRQGELLGLRWEDVDLEGASLGVTGALQRVEGEYRIVEPKTARARRTLPLASPAVEALRLQRQRQREERLRAGPLWEDWGWCSRRSGAGR